MLSPTAITPVGNRTKEDIEPPVRSESVEQELRELAPNQ